MDESYSYEQYLSYCKLNVQNLEPVDSTHWQIQGFWKGGGVVSGRRPRGRGVWGRVSPPHWGEVGDGLCPSPEIF